MRVKKGMGGIAEMKVVTNPNCCWRVCVQGVVAQKSKRIRSKGRWS